jgi:hypothetical protein
MVSNFIYQNILFLKGISMDDIIEVEDIYQKELLNNLSNNNINTDNNIVYEKIPKHFSNFETWKKTTNVRCWYCSLKFKNTPWFIILNTNSTADGVKYDITGNFCCVGCLKGYINTNYNQRNDFDIYESVKFIYKLFYNKKITEIKPSPNKYNLKMIE